MCDPVTAFTAIGGALLSSQMNKPPNMPSVSAPATPQASKAPNAQQVSGTMAGTGQGGGSPGAAQTLLTGAGGIDPNDLKLGKTTLLGG